MKTKRLGALRAEHVFLTRSAFFMIGIGITLMIMKIGVQNMPTFSFSGKVMGVYTKVGWVVIPLTISACVLMWQTIQHFFLWKNGKSLSPRQVHILMKISSLSPQLGLLGTVIGVIVALTSPVIGLSVEEAQAHKAHAIGTALFTTMIGVILSMGAEIQIPELEVDSNES